MMEVLHMWYVILLLIALARVLDSMLSKFNCSFYFSGTR